MKPFVEDALVLLNILGLNPLNPSTVKLSVSTAILICFFFQLSLDVTLNWKGKSSIEGFADLVVVCQADSKYLLLVVCSKTFSGLLSELEQFWPTDKYGSDLQTEIDASYDLMQKFLKVYKVTYTVMIGSYIGKPILTGTRTLLTPSYLFSLDVHQTPVFEIMYVFQTVYALMGLVFQLGFDILFLVLILHTVCELKLLKAGFVAISFDNLSAWSDRRRLREFEELSRHHSKVLEFVSKLNRLYSLLLLNQFLTSTLVVCGALLILSADGFTSSAGEVVTYILYLITFMGQMFFYCLAGSRIVDESQSVADAVYDIKWWANTHVQLRKGIALTILRSHRAAKLTAGGVFSMDLECYTNIVKTGMSFFTLIRTIYSKDSSI